MRNLTIRRRKVYSGCLAKAKIYIEDPENSELTIGGTPCRKLGQLKIGGELSVPIGNETTKIYVIADKLSKEYSNEYYQLPEGEEDVVLTGQFQMTPGGSMYRFDENESAGIQKSRKKNSTVGVIILILALALGIAAGRIISGGVTKNRNQTAKEFSSQGMTVTLTKEFKEDSVMGFDASYRSKDVYVLALRERFEEAEGAEKLSLEEYGKIILEVNELPDVQIDSFGGIPGFEYDYDDDDGQTYHDRTYLYKTDDSFWMIQFITFKESFAKYESAFGKWAASVRFDQ